jgi:hypothetical protein
MSLKVVNRAAEILKRAALFVGLEGVADATGHQIAKMASRVALATCGAPPVVLANRRTSAITALSTPPAVLAN